MNSSIENNQSNFLQQPSAQQPSSLSVNAQLKAQMNVSIMSSTKATMSVENEPLTLLFNTAIDKINEQLAGEMGDNAIQKGAESGLDISPEATAERIVGLSTGSFYAYKQNHEGEEDSVIIENYVNLISQGIEQGFKEARTILDGLQVLEGDIASNIDKTYDIVEQKLADFKAFMLENLKQEPSI